MGRRLGGVAHCGSEQCLSDLGGHWNPGEKLATSRLPGPPSSEILAQLVWAGPRICILHSVLLHHCLAV